MASSESDDTRTNKVAVDSDDASTESDQIRDQRRRGATESPPPAERYRMLGVLGEGGMGEVIAAHDNILGREVAIKRMRSDTPSALHISRFLREAQIQGRLDHPTIPPVHELAHDERGLPYFVMKRLSGMTLARIIDRISAGDQALAAQFPRQRLLRAFVDVCLAIELAHTRGVIHRDIKPSNIMLGEFGEVFMIDWGVAKIIGDFDPWTDGTSERPPELESTVPGTVIGTHGYMSPEQRNGDEVAPSSDIYALGCVLFEILTFTRLRKASDTALHPRALEPDVSPELDALCAHATAPDPKQRLASARELGDVTQRFLDGDRDLALRRSLADEHFARAARAATERDLADDQQRQAIREAGRALALDPTHPEAAQLVTWLMLEPPRRMPAELAKELDQASKSEVKRQATLAVAAYAALGTFIPHMILSGVREPLYLVTFTILLALLIGHAALGTKAVRFPNIAPILSLTLGSAMVVLLTRMYSPFIIAPGIAVMTGAVSMGSAMFRTRRVVMIAVVMLSLAVVVPYFLETAGVLGRTMEVRSNQLVISNVALDLSPFWTGLGLAGFVVGLIGLATVISWLIAARGGDARRRLQIQAWQLRQLIPESSGIRAAMAPD